MSKKKIKENVIVKSVDDILEEKKEEIMQTREDDSRQELRETILGLFRKSTEISENRRNFKDIVEQELKDKINDGSDDVTVSHLVKMYEVISKSETDSFNGVSKMMTDLLKSPDVNITVNNNQSSSENDMTKEKVEDINAVLNIINKIKDSNIEDK